MAPASAHALCLLYGGGGGAAVAITFCDASLPHADFLGEATSQTQAGPSPPHKGGLGPAVESSSADQSRRERSDAIWRTRIAACPADIVSPQWQ